MTSTKHNLSLEDVLDEFFFSEEKPSTANILRAIEAHPEYREEIADFAALWMAHEAAEGVSEIHASTMVDDADVAYLQSYVLNKLYERDQRHASAPDALIDAARTALTSLAGANLKRASTTIGLGGSSVLLQKVVSNTIADTPISIFVGLANYLHVEMTGLRSVIVASEFAPLRSFYASGKPTVVHKESWEIAVRSLPLPADEKERLLSLQDQE